MQARGDVSTGRRIDWPELVAGLIVLALAAIAIKEAARLPLGSLNAPEAGFLPWIYGVLLGLTSLVLIYQAWVSAEQRNVAWPTREERVIAVPVAVSLVVYVVLIPLLGFTIATVLFMVAAIASWRTYSLLVAAVIALIVTGAIHILFAILLGMSLPRGLLDLL